MPASRFFYIMICSIPRLKDFVLCLLLIYVISLVLPPQYTLREVISSAPLDKGREERITNQSVKPIPYLRVLICHIFDLHKHSSVDSYVNSFEIFCLLFRPSDAVEQGEPGGDLSPGGHPIRTVLPCPRHSQGWTV